MSHEPSIIPALTDLGFTDLEARIYTHLLAAPGTTGYAIAKAIGKPPANTYMAIESLDAKGAIVIEDGRRRICRPVPPRELLRRLEKATKDRLSRARDAIERIDDTAHADDRIYALRQPEQVYERARAMLEDCREIAMLDLFPRAVERLREPIDAAARRGVRIGLLTYGPSAFEHAKPVLHPKAERIRDLFPGEQVLVITDAQQMLLALTSRDGTAVRQAIWTESRFLCLHYHDNFTHQFIGTQVQALIDGDVSAARLRRVHRQFATFGVLHTPGWAAFTERFARDDAASEPTP